MTGDESIPQDGSRVEAAEAGIHAEIEERLEGREPEEHVTAADAATAPPTIALHHHHPPDPNAGVVRGRLGRGALVAAVVSAALTLTAVVLLAVAIGRS